MFTLAIIFAGTDKVFAQTYIKHIDGGTPDCAPAIPLTCAGSSGPLNPTPGQIYNYSISTDPAAVASVLFFVTDASPVISAGVLTATRDANGGAGDYILNAEAAVYNVAGAAKDIDISWQWFDGIVHEVLVVAYVTGAAGCSDNIEVWRIQPSFSFTLDVLSMGGDGNLGTKAIPASECASPVESATYNDPNLTMDYGENWVFFSVNAANFSDSWMPALSAVVTGGSTIGAVEWAYPADAVSGAAAGWHANTVPVDASAAATNGVVGAAGECIVVRVEVQHGNNPTPSGAGDTETVTLSINGTMYDVANNNYTNAALKDVDEVAGSCNPNVTDTGDFTILARPTITAVAPAPFVTKN
jgi:hypothetical protein